MQYEIKSFTQIKNFVPVFTNTHFQKKAFGTSEYVLIFEEDLSLIKQQIDFLQTQASWAKQLILLPSNYSVDVDGENIFSYSNNNEILAILKNNRFHFALIAGKDETFVDALEVLDSCVQLTLEFEGE